MPGGVFGGPRQFVAPMGGFLKIGVPAWTKIQGMEKDRWKKKFNHKGEKVEEGR
jgi:hypothetical protein